MPARSLDYLPDSVITEFGMMWTKAMVETSLLVGLALMDTVLIAIAAIR